MAVSVAFNNMRKVWLNRDKISDEKKLTLYNALVLSILLYNSSTWSLTKEQTNSLDTFHRRQLRRLLGIFWSDKISNNDLYARCHCRPLSEITKHRRLTFLGHILRRDRNIPANLAINNFFNHTESKKYRGRVPTNIATTTTSDIETSISVTSPTDHNYHKGTLLKLNGQSDINQLVEVAKDRKFWKYHTGYIRQSTRNPKFFGTNRTTTTTTTQAYLPFKS